VISRLVEELAEGRDGVTVRHGMMHLDHDRGPVTGQVLNQQHLPRFRVGSHGAEEKESTTSPSESGTPASPSVTWRIRSLKSLS
jgi:hypothetical protein